ncbi:MAG TPA: GNAT family N-acetyltransferase [Spirochaetota bacterium]|nr:GNAT family N-acetyltransferase [Spirochaetota bacterium]HPQ52771.1 GNAT family N-acetyltransferase [Spirochaetota bacterium]
MTETISLRYQHISDAERFFEILSNPNFIFFPVTVGSLEDEIEYLSKTEEKRIANFEHNFAILQHDTIIGGIGIKVNQHDTYIGEAGYFIDERYHGSGIASHALGILVERAFHDMEISRLELIIHPENTASIRVAEKNGFVQEGLLQKRIKINDVLYDARLFGKALHRHY